MDLDLLSPHVYKVTVLAFSKLRVSTEKMIFFQFTQTHWKLWTVIYADPNPPEPDEISAKVILEPSSLGKIESLFLVFFFLDSIQSDFLKRYNTNS